MSGEPSSLVEELIELPAAFPSRYGVPAIRYVDPTIYRRTYFTHCLGCTFCHDACCDHGVDVDLLHYNRIMEHADALEPYTGIPRARWFTSEYERDPDVPGGGSMRTAVEGGACVFLIRPGRGCRLHAFCNERGIDFRELKSMVDCLFPATFYDDTLSVADEVEDDDLICLGTGPTIYRGVRESLGYYFGAAFVSALDRFEQGTSR